MFENIFLVHSQKDKGLHTEKKNVKFLKFWKKIENIIFIFIFTFQIFKENIYQTKIL